MKHPDLLAFVQAVLDQGRTFISKPQFDETFTAVSTKSSPPSIAPVDVLKREIPSKGEAWFARRSIHENKKEEGTADWEEMVFALRDDHSFHERDFTPTLWDARKICDWDSELSDQSSKIVGFDTLTAGVFEMCHEIPAPLGPRCFPVLVVTGDVTSRDNCFVAVTVPVDLAGIKTSFYSSGRNVEEGSTKLERKKAVIGSYAAAEKVTLDGDKIEWVMATASDAKGNLPMFAQVSISNTLNVEISALNFRLPEIGHARRCR